MKRLFIFLIFSNSCLAQDFLINPDFEPIPKEFAKEYSIEQQVLREFDQGCKCCLQAWAICGKGVFADMNNAFVNQTPKAHPKKTFGEGFACITFFSRTLNDHTISGGYLATKLKKTLRKGHRYEVGFQVALSRNLSNYSTNKIGIYFGEHEIKLDSFLPVAPQIEMSEIVDTSGEYIHFKDTLTATSDFKHLIIGYFPKGIPLKKQYRMADLDGVEINRMEFDKRVQARYSIDDIYIKELANGEDLETEIRSKINLRNIQFKTGSAILLESAKPELVTLSAWLQENGEVHLLIEGHTDDLGLSEPNQTLSENRAKSILQFLENQGIDKNRLMPIGFGEAKPIVPSISEENRALNRRVEVKVVN